MVDDAVKLWQQRHEKAEAEIARLRMALIVMRRTLELGGSPMSVVAQITRTLGETDENRS